MIAGLKMDGFRIGIAGVVLAVLSGTTVQANMMDTMVPIGGAMKHLEVSLSGSTVSVQVQGDANERLVLDVHATEPLTGPDALFDDLYWNARYGWMVSGFPQIPADGGMFIRLVEQTEGLRTYYANRGGAMTQYAPLWEAVDDWFAWDGLMTHNYYAVPRAGAVDGGLYEATYAVYVGYAADQPGAGVARGDAYPGYAADEVTLLFTSVPEPASFAVCLVGLWGLGRGRRV